MSQTVNGSTTTRLEGGTHNSTTNLNRIEGETTQRLITEGGTRNSTTVQGETTTRIEYSGSQTIRNVPSVQGPPLSTSNDTCMGSSSGSINGPGFGIGIGSTWTDRNCVMLKNARELWNMGMKAAAMALFCTDDNNRMALEITGFVCPQTRAQQQARQEVDRIAMLEAENKVLVSRLTTIERSGRLQSANPSHHGPEHAYPLPAPVHASVVDAPANTPGVIVMVKPGPDESSTIADSAVNESSTIAEPPRQLTTEQAIIGPVGAPTALQPTVIRRVSD